jgi:hypothetical protein
MGKKKMKYRPYGYKNVPEYIQIETTVLCNADCEFCTQKKVKRMPKIMEEHVWKKIIDDTRGMGITYRPFLLNEPFTDRRMPDICKYIKKDSTAKIEFNTNAELLTPELADKMLEIGVDIIRFSLDGCYKQEYIKRRRGLDFDVVNRNAEYFCKKAKGTSTFTEVRMINFPGSEAEQELFIEKWTPLASKVLITDLYRYPWDGQTESLLKPCRKIEKEMFFYVDGRATLCCWDTNERAVIGDAKKEAVIDIWNGETLKKHRELLDQGQRDKIHLCSRCDAYKTVDFEKLRGRI